MGGGCRDVLINRGGGGVELGDPPTQSLGKPRDPELDSQPPTHSPEQYTRHQHWANFQKFQKFRLI